jgi:uncharacterized glyoxalase superfamily protein PhnB
MSPASYNTGTSIFPCLGYRDAPAAIAWLKRTFGCEERVAYPDPDGSIAHAELVLGSGLIMLGTLKEEGDFPLRSPQDAGGNTQGIYVAIDDVDAHYARARAAGAEIIYGPRDTTYGSREYGARDCEGHLWSFGTYRPGKE